MVLKNFYRFLIIFFIILMNCAVSQAGEPTEILKTTTDQIIAILVDPELKGADQAQEKQRRIRKTVDEVFDWEEMSRRTLARHWAKRTDPEKKEFIDLYGKHLERTYRDRIGDYSGEKVLFQDEVIDGNYAGVKAKVLRNDRREIEVLYRLKKKDGKWHVYDISIEGVSLINNFRKQFDSIILRSGYGKLIEMLKIKVKEDIG